MTRRAKISGGQAGKSLNSIELTTMPATVSASWSSLPDCKYRASTYTEFCRRHQIRQCRHCFFRKMRRHQGESPPSSACPWNPMHVWAVEAGLSCCTLRRRGNNRSRSSSLSISAASANRLCLSRQKQVRVSTPPPSGAVRPTVASAAVRVQVGGNQTEYQSFGPEEFPVSRPAVCCNQWVGACRDKDRILEKRSSRQLLACDPNFSTPNLNLSSRFGSTIVCSSGRLCKITGRRTEK